MNDILVLCRFAHYLGCMLVLGATLFALYALPAGTVLDAWLRRVQLLALALAILSMLGWFATQAAMMGDGIDAATLAVVALETGFGHVWLGRLGLALALLVLLVARAPRVAQAVVATFFVVSLAGVGHASASTGGAGVARLVSDGLHLLAAAAWLGGLLPLGYVLGRARAGPPSEWHDIARHALPRFSRMGYAAVGALVVTGCVNGAFLVPGVDALVATPYGRLLCVKVGLFVLLLSLAALNRLRLAPRIVAGGAGARRDLAALCRSVALEQALGAGILAAVSLLGTLAPPPGAG